MNREIWPSASDKRTGSGGLRLQFLMRGGIAKSPAGRFDLAALDGDDRGRPNRIIPPEQTLKHCLSRKVAVKKMQTTARRAEG